MIRRIDGIAAPEGQLHHLFAIQFVKKKSKDINQNPQVCLHLDHGVHLY